jgi:hypothetical protein
LLGAAATPIGQSTALARIAEESERLRALAHAENLDMLDYLLGMVVLEAREQQRRRLGLSRLASAPPGWAMPPEGAPVRRNASADPSAARFPVGAPPTIRASHALRQYRRRP